MKLSGLVALMECDPIPWLQSDRPSTASTADAADLDVPSIAKEVAELLLSSLTRFPEERAGESTNVIAPSIRLAAEILP